MRKAAGNWAWSFNCWNTPSVLNDGFSGKIKRHPENLMLVQETVLCNECQIWNWELNKDGWVTFWVGECVFLLKGETTGKNTIIIIVRFSSENNRKINIDVNYYSIFVCGIILNSLKEIDNDRWMPLLNVRHKPDFKF